MNDTVPEWLRRAAAVSWRLLVVGAAIYFGFQALQRVSLVVLAVVLALFPAALMWGPVRGLERRGWRPMLATWTVLLVGFGALIGLGFVIGPALVEGLQPLGEDLRQAYEDVQVWLVEGPLGLSQQQVEGFSDTLIEQIRAQASALGSGLVSGALAAVEGVTGTILALIVTFFILKDGARFADRFLSLMEPETADRVGRGGRVALTTLTHYVRGLAVVGLVDATAIAIGLVILDVPLVIPLAVLVFLGAFFPVIGAFLSGLVAVAVTLVNGGFTDALIVLAIVVAVQQLEGDVILPLVFGRTLQLHPLVILLAIAIGGIAFGIVGAFLSVPIAAVIVAVHRELSDDHESSMFSLTRTIH